MDLAERWAKDNIHEVLGIEMVELTPERVVLKMPVGPRVHQPFGLLHGGASVVLAESAASLGAILNCDMETQSALGIEINANHLRSKRDGHLIAVATPFHRGSRLMVWDVRIHDERDELVCVSRCTIAVVPKRA
jgi:1,4-dihydroxy-2-naphthoyl-CoA hydrolase